MGMGMVGAGLFGGEGARTPATSSSSASTTNPWGSPVPAAASPAAAPAADTPATPAANPWANLASAGGATAAAAAAAAAATAAAAPADEQRFATQLEQLEGMGFTDRTSNISALRATNGVVHAAVERLLGSL